MTLHILFGQRKCDYPGQFAIEALAVMDEYSNGDNPDYLVETLEDHQSTGDFDALQVVKIQVSDDEIEKRLYPAQEAVAGKVED